jgi:toxin secretion/phage lysis holin
MNSEFAEKATNTGLISLLVIFKGWLGWLVLLYVISMCLDYITGTALAIKDKTWSASKARLGLWHKFGSILAVFVSVLTDLLLGLIVNYMPELQLSFSYKVFLSPLVLVWYTFSELGSILENASSMGAPLPSFLKNILDESKNSCNTAHIT